jgi:probable rRNA maturation factor
MSRLPARIDVTIASDDWPARLRRPGAVARRAAMAALAAARLPARLDGRWLELSLLLTDDDAVRRLNRAYRGLDRPTNVLAFALSVPAAPVPGHDAPVPLGDVVVAGETVAAEAAAAGRPVGQHLSHLVVHGVLHLLGYDHETGPDAEEMSGVEVAALAVLGIPDPYDAVRSGGPSPAEEPPRPAVAR